MWWVRRPPAPALVAAARLPPTPLETDTHKQSRSTQGGACVTLRSVCGGGSWGKCGKRKNSNSTSDGLERAGASFLARRRFVFWSCLEESLSLDHKRSMGSSSSSRTGSSTSFSLCAAWTGPARVQATKQKRRWVVALSPCVSVPSRRASQWKRKPPLSHFFSSPQATSCRP